MGFELKLVLLSFLIINLGLFITDVSLELATSIPKSLRPCYETNFSRQIIHPPYTIGTLIELIRKLEFNQQSMVNMRILTTSLLHTVKFDGIEKSQSGVETQFALPYGATGKQFYKLKLLVDHFTFGDSLQFHNETLTQRELCILHFMTSNSLDRWQRGDERITCQEKSMSLRENQKEIVWQTSRTVSKCPIEKGVVQTRWGTVSPGHIISAIASSFQETDVAFNQLVKELQEDDYNITEVFTPKTSETLLNNVVVAAVAGDLAEMVLSQVSNVTTFGNPGRWNDSIFPRAHYVDSERWEMTNAELMGGIDGLILSRKIKEWTNILTTTRLSQILDMYYSERGIGYDRRYRACEREPKISNLLERIELEDQTSATANLLQELGRFDRYLSPEGINYYTPTVVQSYKKQAEYVAFGYDVCLQRGDNITNLEIITILDGSWEIYEALRIISYLVELADVSYYGSRIGVINGQNGAWLANITSDVIRLYESLANATSWPTSLQLGESLRTVISHYQNKTEPDCYSKSLRPAGHVVLILANTARISDADGEQARIALQTLKGSHPHVEIFYVTAEDNAPHFAEFSRNIYGNDAVITSTDDIVTFVNRVSEKLNTAPANIMNYYCNNSNQVEMEDYITPGVDTLYEIHAEYLRRTDVTVKFKGNDYGDFSICAYNLDDAHGKFCKNLTGINEVNFVAKDQCSAQSTPCTVRFAVSTFNTKFKCAEMDCRYPDQTRLDITTSWTTRSLASSRSVTPKAILLTTIVYLLKLSHYS